MLNDSSSASDPSGIPARLRLREWCRGGQYDNSAGKASHDWKSKLAFEAGGGFNVPSSDTSTYLNTGYNFTLGGGMRFSHGSKPAGGVSVPQRRPAQRDRSGGRRQQRQRPHLVAYPDPVIDLMPKRNNQRVRDRRRRFLSQSNQLQQSAAYSSTAPTIYCGIRLPEPSHRPLLLQPGRLECRGRA